MCLEFFSYFLKIFPELLNACLTLMQYSKELNLNLLKALKKSCLFSVTLP